MNKSEYSQKPKAVLMHNPRKNNAIKNLTSQELEKHNFMGLPHPDKLLDEFDKIQEAISSLGIEVLELLDFLEKKNHEEVTSNPNSIFLRDPAITIPWNGKALIKSNMKIKGREKEPELAILALRRIIPDAIVYKIGEGFIEGGDVTFVVHEGQKTIILGYGNRTEIVSAVSLMETLDKSIVDTIFCLRNKSLLHLDTALSILSNEFIFLAEKAFDEAFLLDRTLMFEKVNPKEIVSRLGIKTFYATKDEAMINEVCNLFPAGNNIFIGSQIGGGTKNKIEEQSGIKIISVSSTEIAKGTGGVHCLTRPIY